MDLVSNKENLDSSTPTRKLMLTVIAAINEFERTNLLERQREGIAEARKRGVNKGRKEIRISDWEWNDLFQNYMRREINKKEFAKLLHISRPTLDRLINAKNT